MSSENMQGPPESNEPSFWKELCQLVNKHGVDAKMNVPDWILANYLTKSLESFGKTLDSLKETKLEPDRPFVDGPSRIVKL